MGIQNETLIERNKKISELESVITEMNKENSRMISNHKTQVKESVTIHEKEVQFLNKKIEESFEINEDKLNLLKKKYETQIFELYKKWNSEVHNITKENETHCQKLCDEINIQKGF